MKRFLILFTALVFSTCPLFGQATAGFHRVNQVLARAYSGVGAEIVPNATIAVTNTATGQAATIYFDPTLLSPISPSVVYANDQGNYSYYMALGNCVTETITSPGMSTITIPNICSNTAGSGVVGFGSTQQAAIYTSSGNSVTGGTLSLGGGGTAATTAAGAVQNIVNNQNILPATVKANTVTASVNTQINVAGPPYNAVGDCSTDNQVAINAALRAADAFATGTSGPATVYFPKPLGACYKTSTLAWRGESLQGQSSGLYAANTNYSGVILQGMPGEDILAPGDPTTTNYTFYGAWRIQDLTFKVNDTSSPSFPHRWPGRWVDDISISASSTLINSLRAQFTCGDVGQAISVAGAGPAGATLITTIASVTPCWSFENPANGGVQQVTLAAAASTTVSNAHTYISLGNLPVTTNIGNCAIAFDDKDGNQSDWVNISGTIGNAFSKLTDVQFTSVSGTYMGENNSCAVYFQGAWGPYGIQVFNVNAGRLVYGYTQATSETNAYLGGAAQDYEQWDHQQFDGISFPWISYDGGENDISKWEITTKNGPQILSEGFQNGGEAGNWRINVPEFEVGGGVGWRITGQGHTGENINFYGAAGMTSYLDTTGFTCTNCTAASTLNVDGYNNKILFSPNASGNSSTNIDRGMNNDLRANLAGPFVFGTPADQDYSMFPRKSIDLSGVQSADFIQSGNAATPWSNNDDLMFWPKDIWNNLSPGYNYSNFVVSDTSSISGYDYIFAAGGGAASFQQFSRNTSNPYAEAIIGTSVPATKATIYLTAKCLSSTTFTFQILAQNGSGNTTLATSPSESCTTSFAPYSLDVDFSSYTNYWFVFYNNSATTFYAQYVAIRPWQGNINSTGTVNAVGFDVAGSALATGNLADWTNTSIASGDIPVWNSGTSKWTATAFPQTGLTGSIGGSALTAGQCASGTTTLGTSATGHTGTAAPSDGSNIQSTGGGLYTSPQVTVSGTTATVELCDIIAGTPTAKTYNVSVF